MSNIYVSKRIRLFVICALLLDRLLNKLYANVSMSFLVHPTKSQHNVTIAHSRARDIT
jgi:hypothetical protein